MGTVEFKGEPPFQLILQEGATVVASGGTVMVTLPVSSDGSPPSVVQIQVKMTIEHAEQLYHQIPVPVDVARRNLWSGRES